ncbi:hypothetical protein [Microcoleus sp. herbarium8]
MVSLINLTASGGSLFGCTREERSRRTIARLWQFRSTQNILPGKI